MLDWRPACTLEKTTSVHIKNNNDILTKKTTTTTDNKIPVGGGRWRGGLRSSFLNEKQFIDKPNHDNACGKLETTATNKKVNVGLRVTAVDSKKT